MSALVPATTDAAIARIDKARALLAEAKSMIDVKQVVDMAAAAEVYAKRQKLSDEAIGYAHSIKIDALTRLGEMLKAAPKNTGAAGSAGPGRGNAVPIANRVSDVPTLADLGIDKKVSMVAQQLASLPDDMRQAVSKREATISQARSQVSEQKRADDLARPSVAVLPEGVHHGDFRELAHLIPDESIELVFTDPPYDGDSIELYEAAAKEAARILKPGGSMIAYSGQRHLPAVLAGMSKHLRYWWTIAGVHEGGNQMLQKLGVRCGWKPIVWFVKGTRGDVQNVILDVVRGDREKGSHEWQQAQSEAEYYIRELCSESGTVVDFFLGGGTTAAACAATGRKCIGFEINAAAIENAAKRLAA